MTETNQQIEESSNKSAEKKTRKKEFAQRLALLIIIFSLISGPLICRSFSTIVTILDTYELISDPLTRGQVYDQVSATIRENWDKDAADFLIDLADRIDEGRPLSNETAISYKIWLASYGVDIDFSDIRREWDEIDREIAYQQHNANLQQRFSQTYNEYLPYIETYWQLENEQQSVEWLDDLKDPNSTSDLDLDFSPEIAIFRQTYPEWEEVSDDMLHDLYFSYMQQHTSIVLTEHQVNAVLSQLRTFNQDSETWGLLPSTSQSAFELMRSTGFFETTSFEDRLVFFTRFKVIRSNFSQELENNISRILARGKQELVSNQYRQVLLVRLISETPVEYFDDFLNGLIELEANYPNLTLDELLAFTRYGLDFEYNLVLAAEIFTQTKEKNGLASNDEIAVAAVTIYEVAASTSDFELTVEMLVENISPYMFKNYGISFAFYALREKQSYQHTIQESSTQQDSWRQDLSEQQLINNFFGFQSTVDEFSQETGINQVVARDVLLVLTSMNSQISFSDTPWSLTEDQAVNFLSEYLARYENSFISSEQTAVFYAAMTQYLRERGYRDQSETHERIMTLSEELEPVLRQIDLDNMYFNLQLEIITELLVKNASKAYLEKASDVVEIAPTIYQELEMGENIGVMAELDAGSLEYSLTIPTIDTSIKENNVSMVIAWSYFTAESDAVLIEPVIQEVDGELVQIQNDQHYFDNTENLDKKVFIAGAEFGFEVVTAQDLLDSSDADQSMSNTDRIISELERRNATTAFSFNALYDIDHGGFQEETKMMAHHSATWLVTTSDNRLFVIHKEASYTNSFDGVLEEIETVIGQQVQYIIMGDPGYSVYLNHSGQEYEIAGYNEGSTFRLNASFK